MIVLEWLFITRSYCDAAEPWQLGFQDPGTPMMQGIMDLHHDIFFFLILILVFVSWMLVCAFCFYYFITLCMDLPAQMVDPIDPFQAHAGGPGGGNGDDDDERRRKRIRRALARHLRTFCRTYCQKMRFCGKYCAKQDKLSVANKILKEEFKYHQAAGSPLRNLENLVREANRNRSEWEPQMESHWVYDLMRHSPKK